MVSKNIDTLAQGEIWLFDADPTKGNEIGKKVRACLIISNNYWNKIKSGLVIVIPLTSVYRDISTHIRITPSEGGVTVDSYAICEQIRSISQERLIKKMGKIKDRSILEKIQKWLIDLLRID